MHRIFHPKNWSSIGKEKTEITDNDRRDILFSQMVIFGAIISGLHLLHDTIIWNMQAMVIDVVFVAFLFMIYGLNEKGFHRSSKIIHLTTLNLLFFFLCTVLDERIRMVFIFFPFVVLAFLFFYKSELWLSYVFSVVPVLFVIVLELTDYQPFGDYKIKAGEDPVTMTINVLSSFGLLVFALFFLFRINDKNEKDLLTKEEYLKKINAELDQFVYSASHDLRAPLLSVKGLMNLVKYETEHPQVLEYVQRAEDRVGNLDKFIQDIITHSKNARLQILQEEVHLDKLVSEVYTHIKYMDGASDIRLETELEAGVIRTDKNRLLIVLNNLLTNAFKYYDPEKPDNFVKVISEQQDQHTEIIITDNGLGIEPEAQKRIFEMFYRASEHSTGSGLGLYIVKETLDKMNGSIRVNSEPGKGTSFKITLPQQASG